MKKIAIFLVILIGAFIYGCAGWNTRYSTVNKNNSHIFLNKDGKYILSPCGFVRQLDASYSIDLIGPGPEYNSEKYIISGTGISAGRSLVGLIHVINNKITLKLFWQNGEKFAGNGMYNINADG